MRYEHILRATYCEPWLITASAHAAVRAIVEAHLVRPGVLAAKREPGMDACGNAIEVEQMEVSENGIAHIPVGGVMARGVSSFERGSGVVDTEDVMRDLEEADSDDNVLGILLHVDSPGGLVNGTPELAAAVASTRKACFAYTPSIMASAAYYVSAGADAIYAAPSANVGSIGVYMPVLDESLAYAMHGYKVELIKSGDMKGAGFPGTSLSFEQRKELQDHVDSFGAEFREWVQMGRGRITDADMRGQTFMAKDALERGFIDGIASSADEVEQLLLARALGGVV